MLDFIQENIVHFIRTKAFLHILIQRAVVRQLFIVQILKIQCDDLPGKNPLGQKIIAVYLENR